LGRVLLRKLVSRHHELCSAVCTAFPQVCDHRYYAALTPAALLPCPCRYATPQLKFAKINLAAYQELADEFGIDTSSSSIQLPTLILFTQGKEGKRLEKKDINEVGTFLRSLFSSLN
jgi:hypothetical protein